MKNKSPLLPGLTCLLLTFCMVSIVAAQSDSHEQRANQILDAANIKGGLIVHIGCGDGKLTAALCASDTYLVHGLDEDAENIDQARKHIQSLGLYGKASVDTFDGKRLPYVDNLVNLVVVSDFESGVSEQEIARVLAPGAVALVKGSLEGAETGTLNTETLDGLAGWTKFTKPRPDTIDEWTHFLHGPDNNAVAEDTVVGPPRRLQWVQAPTWDRSHTTFPSITCVVSSGGRLFSIIDQGPPELPFLPGKYTLVARDAFNGTLLWKYPFIDWEPISHRLKMGPVQLSRRLVAIGDKVYVTPGLGAPVTVLDAESGEIINAYQGTERTREILYYSGVLYLIVGDRMKPYGACQYIYRTDYGRENYSPETPIIDDPKCSVIAIEADSGEILWERSGNDTKAYQGTTLAVLGDRAVYQTADQIICVERLTGREIWTTRSNVYFDTTNNAGVAPTLVLTDEVVYSADDRLLAAYSLRDGKKMWQIPSSTQYRQPPDLFVTAGAVWNNKTLKGYHPFTGDLIKQRGACLTEPMGHDRCYRNKATSLYVICSTSGGADFSKLDSRDEFSNPWVRGTCNFGVLPCNGLMYAPSHACSCCNRVLLNGFYALAPAQNSGSGTQDSEERLQRGPAYTEIANHASQVENVHDWPTYRHDSSRSASTDVRLPASLNPCWQTRLSTKPSAPVIAGGRVFVADTDAHAVCALDSSDGTVLWEYTAGGRVDSPPTFYEGLVLFGCRDGWVYCLRASDGKLVWRFRAAPEDRIVCSYGQLESAWPVHGSVLIANDIAYFAAGINTFLDDGLFIYGLDPVTGQEVYEHNFYGPHDRQGRPVVQSGELRGIKGNRADVLKIDGNILYLGPKAFSFDLRPLKQEKAERPHLIASAGFLDEFSSHRTYWTVARTVYYDEVFNKRKLADAELIVIDGEMIFGIQGYTAGRNTVFDPRINGYALFAGTMKQKSPGNFVFEQEWTCGVGVNGKAMIIADDILYIAGKPNVFPPDDLHKAVEGRMGGLLWTASAADGEKLSQLDLDSPPVFDGMAAANGRLYMSLTDGSVVCFGNN